MPDHTEAERALRILEDPEQFLNFDADQGFAASRGAFAEAQAGAAAAPQSGSPFNQTRTRTGRTVKEGTGKFEEIARTLGRTLLGFSGSGEVRDLIDSPFEVRERVDPKFFQGPGGEVTAVGQQGASQIVQEGAPQIIKTGSTLSAVDRRTQDVSTIADVEDLSGFVIEHDTRKNKDGDPLRLSGGTPAADKRVRDALNSDSGWNQVKGGGQTINIGGEEKRQEREASATQQAVRTAKILGMIEDLPEGSTGMRATWARAIGGAMSSFLGEKVGDTATRMLTGGKFGVEDMAGLRLEMNSLARTYRKALTQDLGARMSETEAKYTDSLVGVIEGPITAGNIPAVRGALRALFGISLVQEELGRIDRGEERHWDVRTPEARASVLKRLRILLPDNILTPAGVPVSVEMYQNLIAGETLGRAVRGF